MPNSESDNKSIHLSRQLSVAQIELSHLLQRLDEEFSDYIKLQTESTDIAVSIREKQIALEELKQKHRNDLSENESEELAKQIELNFIVDKDIFKKELQDLVRQEKMIDKKIEKLISTNKKLSQLLNDISIANDKVQVLESEIVSEKNLRAAILLVETKLDLQKRAFSLGGTIGGLITSLGGGVASFVQTFPLVRAAFVGIISIWDAIKDYMNDADTKWGRGAKISAGVGIIALTIATFVVAPLTAAILSAVAVVIGATKDQFHPWRKASNALDRKERELDEVNEHLAHVELGVHRISDPKYIILIEQRDQLQQEVNQLRVTEWNARKKALNGAISVIGIIMCVIPFPPVQILGLALLVVSAVVGLVQEYSLITKAKNFMEWLGDEIFEKKSVAAKNKKDEASSPDPKQKKTATVKQDIDFEASSGHRVVESLGGIKHGVKHTKEEIEREKKIIEAQILAVSGKTSIPEVSETGEITKTPSANDQTLANKNKDDNDESADDTPLHNQNH